MANDGTNRYPYPLYRFITGLQIERGERRFLKFGIRWVVTVSLKCTNLVERFC